MGGSSRSQSERLGTLERVRIRTLGHVLLAAASLPGVLTGHRPGPDALYAKPVAAPQLENAAPWAAEPILVSGTSAYREGEFLHQDFLHDDHGAFGVRAQGDPYGPGGDFTFAPSAGTLSYPDDPAFANNGADLVELRIKPLAKETAFRVTLNTLQAPDRTAFTIALGSSDGAVAWPHGAGVKSPAQLFLTVHGSTAELRDAASGEVETPAPSASVDLRRRQIDVRVPHAAWNPGTGKVRVAAGVGLWDVEAGAYLAPAEGNRTATQPGGGAPSGAALFNVAFRSSEPMPDVDASGAGFTLADAAVGAGVEGQWWREKAQSSALQSGDITAFAEEVDFGKLAARATDDSKVPKDGPMNRILASRHVFGQGVDHSKVCFDLTGGAVMHRPCEGRFVGQLQPYAIYVPKKPKPARGYGLTLLLHSLSANYNQYTNSKNQSQLGERGAGSIVITPNGRGPDGFYTDFAEADTFEVWADVARRYDLDPDWTVVSGYSMGGIGTYRLMSRWPDLFARGWSVVGSPRASEGQMASMRNTPLMAWAAAGDELVHVTDTEAAHEEATALGLRHIADLFETADHLTLATNDEWGPGVEFLGEHRVDRSPAHVTYVAAPEQDHAPGAVVADHAYWLSGVRVRDAKAAPRGTIDVRSEGFGTGDPAVKPVASSQEVLTGGAHGPMPYLHRVLDWEPAPAAAKADRLVVKAQNIGAATVDARRAKVSCAPALDITSDGPLDLRVECPPPPRRRGTAPAACTKTVRIALPRVRGRRITQVTVRTPRGKLVKRSRGRNLRSVVVRRPTRKAFSLRVRAVTSGSSAVRSVTVVRRFGACR